MSTLLSRCSHAYVDGCGFLPIEPGIRGVIEHLSAELVIAGHSDAAGWLLSQLQAEVIQLRPEPEGAA